jgi:hypothetical protein
VPLGSLLRGKEIESCRIIREGEDKASYRKSAQLKHHFDKFVFRFNQRTSRSRGLIFYRLLEQAVQGNPITYRQIVQKSLHEN